MKTVHEWNKDGGPAFPVEAQGRIWRGMSMRQWYAGQALAGLLADPNMTDFMTAVLAAQDYADAMVQYDKDREHV
jgi:hypothetical protein